jgi:hypothetical protein
MAVPLAGLELTFVPGIRPNGTSLWNSNVYTAPAAIPIVAASRGITARMNGCSSLKMSEWVYLDCDGCGDQRDSFSTAPAARRQSSVPWSWFQGRLCRSIHIITVSDTDILLSTQ